MSLKDIGKYSDRVKSFKGINSTSSMQYDALLSELEKTTDFAEINKLLKVGNVPKEIAEQALKMSPVHADSLNDISEFAASSTDAVTNLETALSGLKSYTSTGDDLSLIFSGLATSLSPLLPLIATLGVSMVAISAMSKYSNQFNDAVAKTADSQASYDKTASELNNLNYELAISSQHIFELQALKNAGTISITEQSELETLKLQNAELERQINLKEQTENKQSETTINDAIKALKLQRTNDLTQQYTGIMETGEEYIAGYKKTDIISATKNEIEELSNLQAERSNLLNDINNASSESLKETYSKELDDLDLKISNYSNIISENIGTLNTLRESFKDPITGLMKEGMSVEAQNYYRSITDLIDTLDTLNLSDNEAALVKLDNFFNGSPDRNFIKDALIEAAKAGNDLETVLKTMGLNLEKLGIENVDTLNRYFNDLAASADSASISVKNLADTESIESVAAAFNSKNAGYNYEQAIAYSEKAAELFNQGLVGTDDFKAFADYISYGMDDSIEAYKAGIEKFNRYFTAESNAGLQNFITDLKNNRGIGENEDWISSIGNTAQLANDMGLGIGAVEDILSRMEDFGYITSDQWHSSLKDLSEYKSSLSALEELYNSMDSGTDKEALGADIEEWKSNLQMYEDDLSLLDEKAIIKIKFAYDNTQLEQNVNSSLAHAETSGHSDNAVINYANAIVGLEEIIRNYEEALGLDRDGITIPAKFDTTALYEELKNASDNNEIIEIQAQIVDKNKSYEAYLKTLSEEHPELTPELNIDDTNDIVPQKKIKVDSSIIEEIKDENGTVTYTSNIDGLNIPAEKTDIDGVATYTVNAADILGYNPEDKDGIVNYYGNFNNIGSAPTIFGTAIYTASTIVSGIMGALSGGNGQAAGTLLSPAHADGRISLPQNETALVNELGTESIIRNGKWMLIPSGMHREHLKKGDIILNASQTKSLMKYGKAAGRGRAYADGTLDSIVSNAYADGSGDTPEPETFDWIENRIKHLESLTEDWKNKLESVTTFKAQNSYIDQIILAIQNEISNLNASYNAYMAKAASLGLSSDYVEKIQNGSLSIEDIADEDLQEKIKEYENWYDKAEDCRKTIDDLNLNVKDLNKNRIDNITDDFDNLGGYVSDACRDDFPVPHTAESGHGN